MQSLSLKVSNVLLDVSCEKYYIYVIHNFTCISPIAWLRHQISVTRPTNVRCSRFILHSHVRHGDLQYNMQVVSTISNAGCYNEYPYFAFYVQYILLFQHIMFWNLIKIISIPNPMFFFWTAVARYRTFKRPSGAPPQNVSTCFNSFSSLYDVICNRREMNVSVVFLCFTAFLLV